jgi:aldehyde dehydrogenase (NAD+)
MAEHMNIDAVWSFSGSDLSHVIEAGSQTNVKRSWVNNGQTRDWFGAEGQGKDFLVASTEVKIIWIPYGE